MAFGGFGNGASNQPLAEINMVPLIDVMLVLLIIFMVTAPLLTHAVKVDLPKASSAPNLIKRDSVQLAIDVGGRVYWNGEMIDSAHFAERLSAAAALQPQPELHLHAERTTPYEKVAQVMSEAARHGISRIGFITEPAPQR